MIQNSRVNQKYELAKIGFMQGRLSPMVNGKIQAFPMEHWRKEIPLAAEIGLTRMEWTLDQDGLNDNPFMTVTGQDEVSAICKKWGMSIPSVTGDCFMQSPFFKKNYDSVSLLQDFENVVKSCSRLGTKIIVFPLVDNSSVLNSEEEDFLVRELMGRKNFLDKYGVRIAFESDFAPKELARLISRFSPDTFGINYDIGNSASLGFDPNIEFEAYGERIINVHVKDRPLGGTTVPLGDGSANFEVVFNRLRKIKYNSNLILQTARSKDGQHKEFVVRFSDFVIERFL